jgi:hypothetical protein
MVKHWLKVEAKERLVERLVNSPRIKLYITRHCWVSWKSIEVNSNYSYFYKSSIGPFLTLLWFCPPARPPAPEKKREGRCGEREKEREIE